MRTLFFFLLALMSSPLLWASGPQNSDGSIQKILLLSEQQKYLIKQSAKAFMGLANSPKVVDYYLQIDSSLLVFEENLVELEEFSSSPILKPALTELKNNWKDYSLVVSREIGPKTCSKLLKLERSTYEAAEAYRFALSGYIAQIYPNIARNLKESYDLSSRAYAQAIFAETYMFYQYASRLDLPEKRNLERSLKKVEEQTLANFDILLNSKVNTTSTKEQLKGIQDAWKALGQRFERYDPKSRNYMTQLAQASDQSSQALCRLASEYSQLVEVLSVSHLVAMVSRHRAQNKEMARTYLLAAFELDRDRNVRRSLDELISEFEERNRRLVVFAPTKAARRSAETIGRFWKNYKKALKQNYTEEGLFKLIEQSHIIMAACDRMAEDLENYTNQLPLYPKEQKELPKEERIIHLLNIVGHQTTDIQRLLIYRVQTAENQGGSISQRRYEDAIKEFEQTLQQLQTFEDNTPAIVEGLHQLETLWTQLKNDYLGAKTLEKEQLVSCIEQIDLLSNELEQLSILYENMVNTLVQYSLK
ncbi:hypothetical protein PPO43_10125 [Saprospira sp. CCB-QB6]|uniref:hypothetical protein n=1 Tax=Saprospira sp. CCB-QB6 TaxID=3023936 RepID=UPI00234A9BBA|nr:hypothetical protein [Saprospira sp. CCB-QB6]WCL80332.1 hypothetical protein PPO43_10125 [Saprospira sp. CCB-QB6]